MSLSDTIRKQLALKLAPCETCGHQRMTIAALATELGQPATSVGRFLAGGKPSVALLDAADAYLWRGQVPTEKELVVAYLDGIAVEVAHG